MADLGAFPHGVPLRNPVPDRLPGRQVLLPAHHHQGQLPAAGFGCPVHRRQVRGDQDAQDGLDGQTVRQALQLRGYPAHGERDPAAAEFPDQSALAQLVCGGFTVLL